MTNVLDSVAEALTDRMRSTLVGTYTLTWGACNWRIWPYTFERTPAEEKIADIAAHIGFMAFFWPLVVTAFIALGVPYIQERVTRIVSAPRLKELQSTAKIRVAQLDAKRDQLRAEKLEAESARDAANAAFRTLRQSQQEWSDSESIRTLKRQHWAAEDAERETEVLRAEERLKGLEATIAALKLGAQQAQTQAEEVKAARSEALIDRDRLLAEVNTLVKNAQTPIEELLKLDPFDAVAIRAAWIRVRTAVNGL
jgi:hypothetical protein